MKNDGLFTSLNQDWNTPKDFYKGLNKRFDFNFDPCPENAKFNGILIDWKERNFVNPPYKTKVQNAFVEKAVLEFKKGKLVVMLLPVRTSTIRFHDFILKFATEIIFIKGRLKFGLKNKDSPFDSMVIVFDGRKNNH